MTENRTVNAAWVNAANIQEAMCLVRKGDYAHPGGTEAIDLLWQKLELPSDSKLRLLDIGCGLGGSAAHLKAKFEFENIIAFDSKSIIASQKKYPQIEFFQHDITKPLPQTKLGHIDIMYMLNVFYVVKEQQLMLQNLRNVASLGTKLVIFDYVDFGYGKNRPKTDVLPFIINEKKIKKELRSSGWKFIKSVDFTNDYNRWYEIFVANILSNKDKIIELLQHEDLYHGFYHTYNDIYQAVAKGNLGGRGILAQAF